MAPDTDVAPAAAPGAAVAGDAEAADVVVVGGGLAGGLVAWRLRQRCPGLRFVVVDRAATLGGNHTWSFHDGDVSPAQAAWLAPLVVHRWTAYDVAFPALRRRLFGGYASVTAERFDAVLRPALGDAVRLGVDVAALTPTTVTLADGRVLRARAVVDARGPRPCPQLALGYQSFVGHELELDAAHGVAVPLLMDATVTQTGGYRFVYVLPLDERTLLVEDTCYTDDAALDAATLRRRIAAYAVERGWRVRRVRREEQGVLPIVLDGDVDALWRAAAGAPRVGLAGGLFHPTTGYSLPDACTVADLVADVVASALADEAPAHGPNAPRGGADASLSSPKGGVVPEEPLAAALFQALRGHAAAQWRERRFFRALNRMLFLSTPPSRRWQVMQRFYGLPAPLIQRFYAARLTPLDKLRIVSGRPPVPLAAAARAVFGGVHRPASTPAAP